MTATRRLAATIHDAIEEVTTAIEDVHKSIADLPLEALGMIKPLEPTVEELRGAQARSIGAVYDLIRRANDEVRRLVVGSSRRGAV